MFNFGLRAHDYAKNTTPAGLAAILEPYHPAGIQLAFAKSFTAAATAGALGTLSPGYVRSVRRALEERGISVAVLGCYINPVHPDEDERKKQLALFTEHLLFAPDLGCSVVGSETGSRAPDCSFHPDTEKRETFDTLCRSVETMLSAAEKRGVLVGLEPVAHQHTLSTVQKTARLLEKFPSPCLRVIFDPVNLLPVHDALTPGGAPQAAFFREVFDTFGERIAVLHAKDFRVENGVKVGGLPALSGCLDYDALLSLAAARKPGIDIILENSVPETIGLMRKRFAPCPAQSAQG